MKWCGKAPFFSRQMDKNRGQYAHFKKGANIVAPKNSFFSEIMRVDFEFFFDYAGREQQNLRKLLFGHKISEKFRGIKRDFDLKKERGQTHGTSRKENKGHPIL